MGTTREIEAGAGEEAREILKRLGDFPGLVERHAGLEGGIAALLQGALDAVIEGFAEQRLARTDRIGPVGDDQIEAVLGLRAAQIFERIGHFERQPFVA